MKATKDGGEKSARCFIPFSKLISEFIIQGHATIERTRSLSHSISRIDVSKWVFQAHSNCCQIRGCGTISSSRRAPWIQFPAHRRKRNSLYAGNRQQSRGMPTGSVKNHNDPVQWMPGSCFIEENLHPVAIYMRENQTVELAVDDGNAP